MSEIQQLKSLRLCVQMISKKAKKVLEEKSNDKNHFEKLRAAFFASKLWPRGKKITIGFVGTGNTAKWTPLDEIKSRRDGKGGFLPVDPLEEKIRGMKPVEAVKKVIIERYKPLLGSLDMEFVDKVEDAIVRVNFKRGGGAWSYLGSDVENETTTETMNLGWLDVGTILHEFGHTIGMIHEHQNPYGEPIQWKKNILYDWAKDTFGWSKEDVDTQIINKYKKSEINGSAFDSKSVMLYFYPASVTENGVGTHLNNRFSAEDVLWISKMYPHPPNNFSPKEWYEKTYGEDYNPNKKVFMAKFNTYYVLIPAIIITIVIAYYLYGSNNKRKLLMRNW